MSYIVLSLLPVAYLLHIRHFVLHRQTSVLNLCLVNLLVFNY